MRQTTRICDRCRGCIVEQGSIVEVKAGDLTRQLPSETLDLCEDCSALFLDWLRSGHQANHAGGWPALDVKPHGLPMATAQSD